MNIKKRVISILAASTILAGGIGGGYLFGRNSSDRSKEVASINNNTYLRDVDTKEEDKKEKTKPEATKPTLEPTKEVDWKKLDDVKKMIYEKFDGQIDEEVLLEGAIKGMVNSLKDPYSVYYNKKELDDMLSNNSGKFVGVGIQVSTEGDDIVVVSPIEGGPAKAAGMLPGDIIYKIDDKVYTAKEMEEAVNHMRGKEGEMVKITVKRGDKEIDFEIKRALITMKSVKYEMLEDGMGYLQLTQFTRGSDKDFKAALDELKKQGAKGIILDFRGNPGGYLQECISIASNFIEEGKPIFSTIDKHDNKIEDNSFGGDYLNMPLVLLINEGSASASEVIAGALKDYERAVLVGKKSFGKGIVQSVYDLKDGDGLKLTIAAYYSPKGTNIHKIGIEPDVEVEYPKELLEKPYDMKNDPQMDKAKEELKKLMK